ncbi:zinc finger protein [Saccharopolyspora cebuensis]|uniref:Zinc finger protein n=1 Tax=Saccharopolyspora cebuensis TaxID=418759 RepID=A0ABV4CDN2_9PSEU
MIYRPHPFSWFPSAEERHATPSEDWRHEDAVASLCGRTLAGDDSTVAWLWPTCEPCDVEAHRIAGVPMHRKAAPR